MLDFPATPAEGQLFTPPAGLNTFNYASGKWRQERGWVHLGRGRNQTVASGLAHYILLPAGYQFYKVILRRFEPVTTTGLLAFRVSNDNLATVIATGYIWSGMYHYGTYTGGAWQQTQWTGGTTYVPMSASTIPVINNGGPNMFDIDIDRGGNGVPTTFSVHSCLYTTDNNFVHSMVSGYSDYTHTSGATGLQIYCVDYPPTQVLASTMGAWDLFGAP